MFQHIARFTKNCRQFLCAKNVKNIFEHVSHLFACNCLTDCLTWVLRQRFHLKRVIVTPAVYQFLGPLDRALKCWHWAGVAFCTHLYRLAESLVFVKQSDPSRHCALLSHPCEHESRDPISLGYRANLPISLSWFTLSHLRLLTVGHQCWFWVRIVCIFTSSLYMGSGYQLNRPCDLLIRVSSSSHHNDTPLMYPLSHEREFVSVSSKASKRSLALPHIANE